MEKPVELSSPKRVVMNIRVPFSTKHQAWTRRPQINGWDSSLNARYARALIAELEANSDEFADAEVAAVRLGGGHASHLGGQALWDVVRCVRERYRLAPDVTVSMRCSAADFSGASMPLFRRAGVTRFDLEMLSLSETAFHQVNTTDTLRLYPILCNSFLHAEHNDSLGLVLLVGSPLASDIEVRRSFLEAKNYHCAHITVERYAGPDADEGRVDAQLADARKVLANAGFAEYAPMRFARTGCEDRFFALRQAGFDVIGIGLGAQTRFAGALSTNTVDLDTYLDWSHDFTRITADVHPA